jgi:hypothetical protein
LFEFHLVPNAILSTKKPIENIANPTVRIANECVLVEITVLLWQDGQMTFNKRLVCTYLHPLANHLSSSARSCGWLCSPLEIIVGDTHVHFLDVREQEGMLHWYGTVTIAQLVRQGRTSWGQSVPGAVKTVSLLAGTEKETSEECPFACVELAVGMLGKCCWPNGVMSRAEWKQKVVTLAVKDDKDPDTFTTAIVSLNIKHQHLLTDNTEHRFPSNEGLSNMRMNRCCLMLHV